MSKHTGAGRVTYHKCDQLASIDTDVLGITITISFIPLLEIQSLQIHYHAIFDDLSITFATTWPT